ncbi:MAG TPA: hypothetical protein EYG85_01980 [Crocinitomix sp.]|nr:hypothetical protein [Crocinitomix sp.]
MKYAKIINNELKQFTSLPNDEIYGNQLNKANIDVINERGYYEVVIKAGYDENIHILSSLKKTDFSKRKKQFTQKYTDKSQTQIKQEATAKMFNQMSQFIDNNQQVGHEYYNTKKVEITMQLFRRPQTEVNPIVAEIDVLVMPILDKVNSGDFYSAITLPLAEPTIQEVVDIKNEVLEFATNYVTENY